MLVKAIQKWVPFTSKCSQKRLRLGRRPRPPNSKGERFRPFQIWHAETELKIFFYLFIENICVCNAQLMQKKHSRWCYKTVAAIWTKKFSIFSGNSWTRESVLLERGEVPRIPNPRACPRAKCHSSCSWNKQFQSASRSQVLPTTSGRQQYAVLCKGRMDTNRADICRPWSPVWRRFFDELEANADFEEREWYDRIFVSSSRILDMLQLVQQAFMDENGVKATQKWVSFTTKCSQKRWRLGERQSAFGAC